MFAGSTWPGDVLEKGVGQQQKKAEQSKATSDKNKQVTQHPSIVITVSPTISTNNEPDNKRGAEENKPAHWEMITAIATAILAFITGCLAYFTYWLWRSTKDLVESSEAMAKTQERAYIVCGGLFGKPKLPTPKFINDAADFESPWRMQVHNHGKTPGIITKVEWGVCPEAEFRREILVSQIIERQLLPSRMEPTIDIQEVYAPMGGIHIAFRHIHPERKVGDVFFGKISYDDVFGDPHWSSFAMLHDEHHTTPIGRSFSDDFDKPKRKNQKKRWYWPF